MTRPDAQPTPPAPSATEVEYVRKLSLAILSTLQAKGMLSADEVDAILIAARRAAQGVAAAPAPVASRPEAAPAMQVTVQPAPPLTFHAHARAPQAPADASGEPQKVNADDAAPAQAASPEAEAQVAEPLTVEAPSQPIELGPDVVEDPATPSASQATASQGASQVSEEVSVATGAPPEELDIEPPAQTIVIGPDEVADPVTPPSDDRVLDGAAPAKPAEEPKPAVPTFDLKLD